MIHSLAIPWVVPVVFGCLVAIVAIIANAISITLRANAETSLKRRMVEQGYTVAEIERVIRSSSRGGQPCSPELPSESVSRKPPKQHAL